MPELKNTFTGGKMDKDTDERIVPNGVYREALNINVATSEDSEVGAAQNILGNVKVTEAINGKGGYDCDDNVFDMSLDSIYEGINYHIASAIDPQTDMLYRFVATIPDQNLGSTIRDGKPETTLRSTDPTPPPTEDSEFVTQYGVWRDIIVEYDTTKPQYAEWWEKEKAVMVDIYKVQTKITESEPAVPACNKSYIKVCINSYQLRQGMVISSSSVDAKQGVYIESISYTGTLASITLSENIDVDLAAGDIVTFHGDRVLSFHPDRKITGINIVDGMIFWTDDYSEPKKVNIKRGKIGSQSKIFGSGFGFDSSGAPINNANSYGCQPNDVCWSDFDQHTKLIVGGAPIAECEKDTSTCDVEGCMDPTMSNFNPSANIPCATCCTPFPQVDGCTDPLACNYDPLANTDDGSCEVPIAPCEECDGVNVVGITGIGTDNTTYCDSDYDCIPAGFDTDSCADDARVNVQGPSYNSTQTINHFDFSTAVDNEFFQNAAATDLLGDYHFWLFQNSSTYVDQYCGTPSGHTAGYDDKNEVQTCVDNDTSVGDHRFKTRIKKIELCEVNLEDDKDKAWDKNLWTPSGNTTNIHLQNVTNYWDSTDWKGVSNATKVDLSPGEYVMIKKWVGNALDARSIELIIQEIVNELDFDGSITMGNQNGQELFVPDGTGNTDLTEVQNILLTGLVGSYPNGSPWSTYYTAGQGNVGNTSGTGKVSLFLNIVTEPCVCVDSNPVDCIHAGTGAATTAGWAENFQEVSQCVPVTTGTYTGLSGPDNLAACQASACYSASPFQFNIRRNSLKQFPDLTLPSPLKSGKAANDPVDHVPQIIVSGVRGSGVSTVFTEICKPVYVLEKHLTVIKKGPTAPVKINMFEWDDYTGSPDYADINNDEFIVLQTTFGGGDMPNKWNYDSANVTTVAPTYFADKGKGVDGSNVTIFYDRHKELHPQGTQIILPIDISNTAQGQPPMDWQSGDRLIITHDRPDGGGNTITATCKVTIDDTVFPTWNADASGLGWVTGGQVYNTDVGPYNTPGGIRVTINSTSDEFPKTVTSKSNQVYVVKKIKKPPLFEIKFPRFSYRYKYEDGEYSVFAPWSEVAFMPGDFDYLPKKGYNLGMVNNMRSVRILDWNPKNRPSDVVEIDLLYKESNSPNVYTVKTFKSNDPLQGMLVNPWNKPGTGSNKGNVYIQSELIHKTVPSNQMLRPWDNVPRVAKAQEVTANRLIFANYLQNYNMLDENGDITMPEFNTSIIDNEVDWPTIEKKKPMKSLKSMRNYQVGVVYRDRYGRETPVMTDPSGSVDIEKKSAKLQNKLKVTLKNNPPAWAESYTFYIKETSNEYYNLSMDRWYNADDDGIWISFPSSERNKISERSMLMLKKQHDSDTPVESGVKYKVLDIKNDAPTFIKTEFKFWGSLPMMLPPPGWGTSATAGNWDTGMFHLTGIPLPNRLYLDVYAEYFDQSVLSGLLNVANAQIRVVQSDGQTSAYNAAASSTVNKSDWYDVANISYIGAPAETFEEETEDPSGAVITREVEIPGQAEQIVRITLEQIMGEDMSFCEPLDNLSLSRGLALEARTSVVRDRSQFQGRFFVKILRDSDIQENIVLTSAKAEDDWQVLMNRDVKYIAMSHPGVQEWMTGKVGTVGAGKGRWYGNEDESGGISSYNYIPVGKKWDTAGVSDIKCEVSSYHSNAGEASYYNSNNALKSPPTFGERWPLGPGYRSNRAFAFGWWYQRYYDFLDKSEASDYYDCYVDTVEQGGTTTVASCGTTPIWPNFQSKTNNWPSFMVGEWDPRICAPCNAMDGDYFAGQDGEALLDLTMAEISQNFPSFGDISGANPMQIPAVWGDNTDILGYTGNAGSPVANAREDVSGANFPAIDTYGPWTFNNGSQLYPSEWKKDTIKDIRHGWYHLWYGRDKVDSEWPLGRFEPNRWFIDKAGAANGYSGAGIWDHDVVPGVLTVSRMDLSFWGIGKSNTHERSHDMDLHQSNAVAFGELIATVGTQFRFKQDPNQTVYTVTEANMSGAGKEGAPPIFNFETFHGSWGYEDADGNTAGGGSMGASKLPPWGSKKAGGKGIAGKAAFFSDLFNSQRELVGGHPWNYRQRITITLDKQIGSEGAKFGTANMGFHPIKNHVDADGNCNIKGGAKRYSSLGASGGWKASAGTFPEDIGGLPNRNKYFNLSSYWNKGTVNNGGQDDQMGVGDIDGQHFGLHERGINSTTIEIITPYKGDDPDKLMSKNPGVFETEPMEDVGLDIYYAASPSYPIDLKRIRSDEDKPDLTDVDFNGIQTDAHYFDYNWRGEEMIPVGARVEHIGGTIAGQTVVGGGALVTGVQGDRIYLDGNVVLGMVGTCLNCLQPGAELRFTWHGEGAWYGGKNDTNMVKATVTSSDYFNLFKIQSQVHKNIERTLSYYNCYTFSNGVESNRVRDDYNAVTIDKGVKASMPLWT